VLSALVWARAHAAEHGGDPQKIVLAGHSAGAHLIMTLATSPERLRARGLVPEDVRGYVALSGIYDVPGLLERADPELREVLVPLFGDTPAAWSVLERLGPQLPPTLFVVGEVDYRTCRLDLTAARARLRGLGRAAFLVLEGQTHAEVVLGLGGRRRCARPAAGGVRAARDALIDGPRPGAGADRGRSALSAAARSRPARCPTPASCPAAPTRRRGGRSTAG
jgi:acetyl esterase/lipase